jgi:hypothetical protein
MLSTKAKMFFLKKGKLQGEKILYASMVLACVTGCGARDISVDSDVGEKIIIKPDSITTSIYNNEAQADKLEQRSKTSMAGYYNCMNTTGLGTSGCWGIYKFNYTDKETLSLIRSLPKMKKVKYRTIFIDVNGDKTASDYKFITCLPKGTKEDRIKWDSVIEGSTNIVEDSTIGSIATQELCKRYGI